ncbi:U4/U6 small nuclear ribonucleoprotein Prp3 [Trichoplax sp. H2]|nr:U4/U6 small nuclear ribonucleoprotein Prp3 [Trichoplax sp. H2]|eukprot:RDD37215.1 U4/U6 small nuclear ribonucleoprotein Prp3 [Trichoplax sp. H2]
MSSKVRKPPPLKEDGKRTIKDVFGQDDADEYTSDQRQAIKKPKRFDPSDLRPDSPPLPPPATEGPAELSKMQIKNLMEITKRQIEERKKQLQGPIPQPVATQAHPTNSGPLAGQPLQLAKDAIDKARKAAELQAKIQQQFSNKPDLLQTIKSIAPGFEMNKALPVVDQKPKSVILDKEGRIVDASGKAIQMTRRMPTLKANITAKKVEQFKTDKIDDNLENKSFFDPRVNITMGARNRRSFKFHEQGKFERVAQQLRAKEKLEKLKNEIASVAQKTGISSATKIAMLVPHKEALQDDLIPDVEWWDSYNDVELIESDEVEFRAITKLVEHPPSVKIPGDQPEQIAPKVYLTKKERKKIRRQKRKDIEAEKQEKVRLGAVAPPEPKVKLSNLMRVLGNEAIQDPTKVEAHVRKQMVQRQRVHEAANAARKLTSEQKREKKIRKLKDDMNTGCHVSVYRVYSLNNQSKRYKVDANAQQFLLTGCVVMFKDINIVIVEGGPKSLKKYKRLMLHRIKWNEDVIGIISFLKFALESIAIGNIFFCFCNKAKQDSNKSEERRNKCCLIWEGQVKEKAFNDWRFKSFTTEIAAREHLKKYGVEHYWDLALSMSIIGEEEN